MQAKHDQSATITKESLKGGMSFQVPAHPSQAVFVICQVRTPPREQLLSTQMYKISIFQSDS